MPSCVRWQADLVGRLGGDEFIVLLRLVSGAAAVARVAGKLQAALDRPIELPTTGPLSVGCSIGGALAPLHGSSVEQLIHKADQAMYRAKADPGVGFALADPADAAQPATNRPESA